MAAKASMASTVNAAPRAVRFTPLWPGAEDRVPLFDQDEM
jgi:hypothetical protein